MTTSVLDNVRIASPCKADWSAMKGDDRVRFCAQCKLHVYNLSGMRREEAEQIVRGTEGRLCVRFWQRADGTMITRDCPTGLNARQRRLAWVMLAVLGVLSMAAPTFGRELAQRWFPGLEAPSLLSLFRSIPPDLNANQRMGGVRLMPLPPKGTNSLPPGQND